MVERWRRGDGAAFDALVQRHQAFVARVVHRLLGWTDESADVTQEVFVIALTQLKTFRGDSTLTTWLGGIAVNCCRKHVRRLAIRRRWFQRASEQHAEIDAPAGDAQLITDETAAVVRDAVRQLRPIHREVIVLHYLEQLPLDDVAAALGIRRNTAEVRLHRARAALRTILETQGVNG